MALSLIRIRRRTLAVAASSFLTAALIPAASASAAETPTIFTNCPAPTATQALLAYGDTNYYALAPDGDFADPSAPGWQLSGGARIVSAVRNGVKTNVLNLPSGAKAVTPPICVTRDYPLARMWIRNSRGTEVMSYYVSYAGTSIWTTLKNSGQVHGSPTWALSGAINLQPYNVDGWMQARIRLVAGGLLSDFQVDDLWIDPKLRR